MYLIHFSLLILPVCVVLTSATAQTCPDLESDAEIKLETPKMEQVEWGMDGQGVKVKLTWNIPAELKPCLQYVQIVRKTKDLYIKSLSAPLNLDPSAPSETVLDMTPGDNRDTFILATFGTSGGRIRKVLTSDTWINPISCAKNRPEIKNLTVSQASPGKVHLKWDVDGNEECQQFYFVDIKYMKAPFLTDNTNVEVVRVPKGQKEIDLDIPKNTLITYTVVVAKEDADLSGTWYEDSLLYESFITTDQGGCAEDFNEPSFIGDEKARMTPLPRKDGEQQKLLLDWSHLKVSHPECVTYYVIKYWPESDKYESETVDVPSNQTSVELEFKDRYGGRPGKHEIKLAPSWRVSYWDFDWDELVPTLTANL